MTVANAKPYDRKEMLRRRAARAKYEFKMYSFQEMAWFGRHPKDWDEECRLSGTLMEESPEDEAVREIAGLQAMRKLKT